MKKATAAWALGLAATTLLMSCGSPAPPVGVHPSALTTPSAGPIQASADREAQSNLRNGVVAAKVFFTDGGSYAGFDAAQATGIEPSLTWADGGAATATRVVHIHVVSGSDVILDTRSGSGTVFCIEDDATGGTTFGTVDATAAAGCRGAW